VKSAFKSMLYPKEIFICFMKRYLWMWTHIQPNNLPYLFFKISNTKMFGQKNLIYKIHKKDGNIYSVLHVRNSTFISFLKLSKKSHRPDVTNTVCRSQRPSLDRIKSGGGSWFNPRRRI